MVLVVDNTKGAAVNTPPLDPTLTTHPRVVAHLRGSDAVATITKALVDIGVPPAAAREQATACVQRTFADLRPIVAFHCAEHIWRLGMGDEFGTRSFAAYAEQGPGQRDQAAKILRDVESVLAEADRCYRDHWTSSERVRAATHRQQFGMFLRGIGQTLQQKANAIIDQMTPGGSVA